MQTVLTNPKRPALRLLPRQRCADSRCAKAAAACAPGAGQSARQAAQCPQPGCAYTPGTNRLATVHGNRRPSGSPALAHKYDASGRMTHKTEGPAQRYLKYDMTGKVTGIYRDSSCNTALATFTPDDPAQAPVVAYTYLRGVQAETWQQFQTALCVPDPGTVEVALGSDDPNWQADCDDLRLAHADGLIVQEQHTYAYGRPLPGLNYAVGTRRYRYGYQGQYAEQDPETGFESFELRLYNARIGRWTSNDPEGQFSSPYVGMGNNPVSNVDPDGGWAWFGAFAGAAIGAGVGAATTGTWKGAAIGAGVGFLAGGLLGPKMNVEKAYGMPNEHIYSLKWQNNIFKSKFSGFLTKTVSHSFSGSHVVPGVMNIWLSDNFNGVSCLTSHVARISCLFTPGFRHLCLWGTAIPGTPLKLSDNRISLRNLSFLASIQEKLPLTK